MPWYLHEITKQSEDSKHLGLSSWSCSTSHIKTSPSLSWTHPKGSLLVLIWLKRWNSSLNPDLYMNCTTSHSCILHSLTSYLYTRNYYRIFITMSHLAIASLLSNIIIIIILLSLCFLALLSCTYMTWTLSYSLASSTSDSCLLNAILRNIQITCICLFCLLSYLRGCPYDYDYNKYLYYVINMV